jgi:hypothetical protein
MTTSDILSASALCVSGLSLAISTRTTWRQFERQSFENGFFQLLAIHDKIIDDIREASCSTEGRPFFKVLWKRLKSKYEEKIDGRLVSEDTEEFAVDCYERLFEGHPDILAHYFRNLYQIIKFVDESGISDKKRYTSIVRAQLSTYEHILLHYNGLSCEVLLNLDSDGIARLFKASDFAKNEAHLDALFGDGIWRSTLNPAAGMTELSRQILTLYKQRLRSIPRVRYVFAFAMHDANGKLSYHLVFASQHPLGLEKMKEAMESVDKSGLYTFSDATAGQSELPFDFKQPAVFARRMQAALGGTPRPYGEFSDYALNETPFKNPKKMLEYLKKQAKVEVEWHGLPAKLGFPEEKIKTIILMRETDQLI